MRIKTAAAAAGCAVLEVVGLVSPATASSSGGATVVNQSGCQTYPWGVYQCTTQRAEINTTTTPSGNTVFETNGTYDYSVTFLINGYHYTESGVFHEQYVLQPGQTQEFSDRFSDTRTTPEGTCVFTGALHYANGQFQFDNTDFTCTP